MRNRIKIRVKAGVVLTGALLLSACTASSPDQEHGHHDGDHADIGDFGHVHGLAVDSDDRILLGTHHGVFSLEDGSIHGPVSEYGHDMMSFVMTRDGTLYGSGHPDHDRGWPDAMGLVRSDDGGVTWESVSLLGEVDFHDLEIRDGWFYGYNSGTAQVLVSDDGNVWTAGAQIGLYDLAVNPSQPGQLIGTTPEGLVLSEDGGQSFTLVSDGPSYPYRVLWRDNGEIVVIDTAAEVYVASDLSGPWTKVGSLPDIPQAVIAIDDEGLLAALANGVFRSDDGGRSWERVDLE